jgi:predicted metal-dependent enzyme (double-stranded beta helix superfamily)
MIERPHARDLEREELRDVVSRLAERPELWREHVSHSTAQRHYAELLRDLHLSLWVICWTDRQDTGFHDHDLSRGAVAVVEGSVVEERLALGRAPLRRRFEAGQSFDFHASDIHRVFHAGDQEAVTLHAYSPPLWRMGAYLVEPDGRLRRESQSYAEELRPLDTRSAAPPAAA